MDKYIIGITGNIGSGKSTFARWFADYNFYVIDMDLYAKNLYFNYSFRRKATDILGFDPIYIMID
jgi:dephospho-CoA kinase